MIKYSVRNIKHDLITNSWTSDFADENYYEPSFGKKERWSKEESENESEILDTRETELVAAVEMIIDEDGVIIQEAIPAIMGIEYLLKKEFTIESEDITEQLAEQEKIKNALKAQEIGALCIAKVWAINESKNISAEQFNAILADQTLLNIERLLWNGSLKTAKILIQSLGQEYFSTEEKNSILQVINDSGLI